MAQKLQDDHIRWILDIEAKGVQAELQKITSSSIQLANANKILNNEIKDAEKQMKECLKEMKLLEKQGLQHSNAYKHYENTLESARADIEDYTKRIAENTQKIAENDKNHKEIIKTMNLEDMTMSQLKQRAADLQKQMDHTSASLSPEAYKKLESELNEVNKRIDVVKNTNKSLLGQLAGMNHPIGTAAKAVQGFGTALKALIANPVGIVIMAIAAAFMAFKAAINSSEEASGKFQEVLSPLKALLGALLGVIQKAIIGILNVVQLAIKGIGKVLEYIPFVGKAIKEVNEKAREAVQIERDKLQLSKDNRERLVQTAKLESQVAEDRNKAAQKDKYSAAERLKFLDRAIANETKIAELNRDKIKQTLALAKAEALRDGKRDKATLDEIAQLEADLINAQSAVDNTKLRLTRERSATEREIQREGAEAAKKARENELKEIEKSLNLENNKLKQARMQGLLTEEQYNDKVEELTTESIKKKMAIRGQEQYQMIQYEADLLDAQIKQQEKADKILLEELTKTKENQLQVLDESKNESLAILQEQETDQKIYALRAAEIESEYAQKRLDTIRDYGQSVEQAEFNNAKTREDAITKANEEITKSESENLKEQEKLRKLFAKTTADFERQYNIKTWEQRKEDELRILEKQYEAGLLSEETYRLALQVIEKKYEDEKLKIRQQYGLASMAELYNSEIEALLELHEKGLLSEDEYQRALLDLKLKYAQEYANKAGEFAKTGADTVKAFSEAETASLDAEYTKRQSALTELYNQGVLSQEEYNAQKEDLDYEQRKKELDIQKKYADVNFSMQASEIISSGAVAAINAYKAMAGIPYVGPALGAAAAALVAVTTAMRLKQAKAERDRVKAMTLESPGGGSGGGAPKTGTIQLKEGFAEGGLHTDGGYTGDGDRYQVAGRFPDGQPYHRSEYVVAAPELQQPYILNMVRSIESVRRQRTHKNAVPGFAEGGLHTDEASDARSKSSGAEEMKQNNQVMSRMLAVLQRLEKGDIVVQTHYGVTELEAVQKEKYEYESKFDRK